MPNNTVPNAWAFFDTLMSSFVTGIVFQVSIFTLSNIFLAYLPFSAPFAFYYTLLFSLTSTLTLTKINQDIQKNGPPKGTKIPEIIASLKKDGSALIKFFSNQSLKPDENFSATIRAGQYLLCAIVLYNFPQFLSLVMAYIFLSLHYGEANTKKIINLPLLAASSLFGLLLGCSHSFLSAPLALISIFVLSLLHPKGILSLKNRTSILDNTKNTLISLRSIVDSSQSIDIRLTALMLLALLVSPFIAFIPHLAIINTLFTSTLSISIQSFIATILVGTQLKSFLQNLINDQITHTSSDILQNIWSLSYSYMIDQYKKQQDGSKNQPKSRSATSG